MNFKTKSIVSAFVIYTICALSSLIFFLIGNQGNGDSKFLLGLIMIIFFLQTALIITILLRLISRLRSHSNKF